MYLCCLYCHRLFSRADSRIRQSSGSDKTREDVRKIPFPAEKHHGIPSGTERGDGFRFKTSSGAHHLESATSPYSCHGVFTDRSIFSLNLSRIQIPTGTSVTNCNHKHGLMLTCRHDVDMFTWGRIVLSSPKRAYVDWNWPIWREKISKNRLVCKNAVALAYYGSCRLLVMGSWHPPVFGSWHGCGKTCFTESSLLDHLEELSVTLPPPPPPTLLFITAPGRGKQFHEGIPESDNLKSWFPKCELLVLDDLMAEGGEDKAFQDLFTKHSHYQNITVTRHVSNREIR